MTRYHDRMVQLSALRRARYVKDSPRLRHLRSSYKRAVLEKRGSHSYALGGLREAVMNCRICDACSVVCTTMPEMIQAYG